MKTEQLLRLAENNDPQGLYELGLLFVKGKTVRKDGQRGMMMIRKAAALGYQQAIDLLQDIARRQAIEDEKQRMLDSFHLKEVTSAPSLTTINGIGFKLLGKSNYDPVTQSFEATHYFVFAWIIPICPTARYRVIQSEQHYRFMGKLSLQPQDWIPTILVVLFVIYSSISGF